MTITIQPGEDKYVNEEWVNHERRTMIQPDGLWKAQVQSSDKPLM
jgi:hypothetical protein